MDLVEILNVDHDYWIYYIIYTRHSFLLHYFVL
jgi:hypothetical protein